MQVICKKCNKKPDTVQTWLEHYSNFRVIMANCHGTTEKRRISAEKMFNTDIFYVFDDERRIRMKARPLDECDY